MPKRLKLSLKRDPALQATRGSVGKSKLVYVLVADEPLKYAYGRSRIAYIRTTKTGVGRIAQSVAAGRRHSLPSRRSHIPSEDRHMQTAFRGGDVEEA